MVPKITDTACDWTRPIYYNSATAKILNATPDGKAVLDGIIGNNEMGAKKCGWKPPVKTALPASSPQPASQ